MFTVTKQFVEWDGTLYWIKRQIKEENINPDLIHEYKEYICADTILRKNGASLEEQIAGLLHDVSHTVFSHF